MPNKQLYFFDSQYATKNNDVFNGNNDPNFFYHTFNITYPFKFPIRNLRKMTLKSVEIPLNIPNIRINNGTHFFPILFSIGAYSNISKQIFISPGTYTNTTILTAINTAISSALTTPINYGANITLSSVTDAKSGLSVCSIAHNCTSLQIQGSPLQQYILGFNTFNPSSTSINGSGPINTNFDIFLYMQIANIPIMNNNNINPAYTFKIPLNNVTNNTAYYYDTKEHQSLYFNESTFVLFNLNVVLLDKYGFGIM